MIFDSTKFLESIGMLWKRGVPDGIYKVHSRYNDYLPWSNGHVYLYLDNYEYDSYNYTGSGLPIPEDIYHIIDSNGTVYVRADPKRCSKNHMWKAIRLDKPG